MASLGFGGCWIQDSCWVTWSQSDPCLEIEIGSNFSMRRCGAAAVEEGEARALGTRSPFWLQLSSKKIFIFSCEA